MKNQLLLKFQFQGEIRQLPLADSGQLTRFLASFCRENKLDPAIQAKIIDRITEVLSAQLAGADSDLLPFLTSALAQLSKLSAEQTVKKQAIKKPRVDRNRYYRPQAQKKVSVKIVCQSKIQAHERQRPKYCPEPSHQIQTILLSKIKQQEPAPIPNGRGKDLYCRALLKKARDEKKSKEALEREIKEAQRECTFKPSINQRSKSRSRSQHNQSLIKLYQIGKQRNNKRREPKVEPEVDLECTFKPTINSNAGVLKERSKSRPKRQKTCTSFDFKPRLCQRSLQMLQNLPPFEERLDLYIKSKFSEPVVETRPQYTPLAASSFIVEEKKERIFAGLFQLMDNERFGFIGAKNHELGNLPTPLAQLLQPLVSRMGEVGLQDWVRIMHQFYEGLQLPEKHLILDCHLE